MYIDLGDEKANISEYFAQTMNPTKQYRPMDLYPSPMPNTNVSFQCEISWNHVTATYVAIVIDKYFGYDILNGKHKKTVILVIAKIIIGQESSNRRFLPWWKKYCRRHIHMNKYARYYWLMTFLVGWNP